MMGVDHSFLLWAPALRTVDYVKGIRTGLQQDYFNPFMDGSFSEWLARAELAPHLPSCLTAGAKQ